MNQGILGNKLKIIFSQNDRFISDTLLVIQNSAKKQLIFRKYFIEYVTEN